MIVRPGSSTELVTEAGFQSATMAPPGDLSSKSGKRRLVEKILESRGLSQNQGLEDEILKYLTYKPTDTEADDGLLFWQNHRSDYPTLTKVACLTCQYRLLAFRWNLCSLLPVSYIK